MHLQHTVTAPAPPIWPSNLAAQGDWFAGIRPCLKQLAWQQFPDLAAWDIACTTLQPCNAAGAPIRFVVPADNDAQGYEPRIADTGEVATRPNNWHDCFNALVWLSWPRSKAALNALHMREISLQTGPQRSRARDAATLLDESGLILAHSHDDVLDALYARDWSTLFVEQRGAWGTRRKPLVFGHAVLEKALSPYIGMVAKVVPLAVPASWFALGEAEQLAHLDEALAKNIAHGALSTPASLPPMPLLGIPGWWPRQDAQFYADQHHFRPPLPTARPA
ncbi:DUF3025 domain-containing protein [Chitinimonas sp.]|uniref:DUF3025 domain-containing protein n=1 Tax=Chitinimonas sp. TaxID=1934313 RepID=UPI0035B1DF9E